MPTPSNPSRRRFIAATAATAGGFAAAGLAAGRRQDGYGPTVRSGPTLDNPKPGDPVSQTAVARNGEQVPGEPPEKIGLAVVGIGNYAAGQILPNLHAAERVRLTGLVSGDRAKREAFAARYGVPPEGLYGYDDFDRIADNDAIDAVYVILPTGLHEEYTVRAARAGKHVICEKPMARNTEECRRMIRACEEAGRKLMIGYRCHYETYNRRLMELAEEQPFGKQQFVTFETMGDVGGEKQWRLVPELAGGGSLWDIGIYALNGARYATGEEPTHISAMTYSDPDDPRFKEVEQNCAFQLRFPSGTITNGLSSYQAGTNRCRVICDEGWYQLEPATSYSGQRLYRTGERGAREIAEVRLDQNNMFAAQLDHLAEAILEDEPVRTPGEEGLRDVHYMELIYRAAREGRTIEVSPPQG